MHIYKLSFKKNVNLNLCDDIVCVTVILKLLSTLHRFKSQVSAVDVKRYGM